MLCQTLLNLLLCSLFLFSPGAWAAPTVDTGGTSTETSSSTKKERKKKKKKKKKKAKRAQKKKGGKAGKAVKKAAKKVKEGGQKAASKLGKGAKKVTRKVASTLSYEMLLGRGKDSAKVIKCLKGTKSVTDLAQETQALLLRPGRAVTAKFDEVWQATSSSLKKHASSMKIPKNIKKLPRFAWDLQLKVARDAGKKSKDIKILACILGGMDRRFKTIEPHLQRAIGRVQAKVEKQWKNEIAPALSRKVVEQILEQLRTSERGRRVADTTMRVTGKMLLAAEKANRLERQLITYRQALESRTPQAAKSAFKELKTSLLDTPEPARVLVHVAEELVQEEIEKVIDTKFAPLVDRAIATVSSGVAVVNGVIDGVCGLIPEVGAAVCTAFITRSIRLSHDWVIARYLRDQIIAKTKALSRHLVKYAGSIAYDIAGKKADKEYAQIRKRYRTQFSAADAVLKPVVRALKRDIFPMVQAVHDQRKQMIALLEQANASAARAR